jgi:uncharacterized protein
MLLVKTKIEKSKISGFGLFADQFIPKGTIIWRFNPMVDKKIHKSIIEVECERSVIFKNHVDTYYWRKGEYYYSANDDGKMINHSFNPNTDDPDPETTIANTDIQIGEEITSNYQSFDDDFETYKHKLK